MDANIRAEARAAADRIKERTQMAVIETGRDLVAIKEKMPHGDFQLWIDAEFQMSPRTAENYMNAAKFVEGKNATVAYLPPAALYALASPSASPEVVKQVLEEVDAGKLVTAGMVRERLNEAAAAQRKVDTAKSLDQIKKDREAEKRRRAAKEKANLKFEAEQEAIKAASIKRARSAAEFLVSEIGGVGVLEFLRLLGNDLGEFCLLFRPSRLDGSRSSLTATEIEEQFAPKIALPDESDPPRALS